jgi:hypothetical protein
MKKIKILLLSLSILLTFNVFAANLTYKFTNMKIVGSNLVFDVEIKSDASNTYLAGFECYINYSTAGFGTSIAPNVTLTNGPILPGNYVVSKSNNTTSRLFINGVAFFAPYSAVLTTYQKLFTLSMPIINSSGNAGVNFHLALMGTGNTWYPTSTGGSAAIYTPVLADNNLTNLPLNPNKLLLISEVGDPSNTTTNFVEIYNAGATAVDFTNNYSWFLNFNGSSSVQLTGTLAAGGKYTVAYDNTDFSPTLVNTNVGTGGTTSYLLTTYGDYSTGTGIDAYNGTLTGFDYTGKHAVRIYNIATPTTSPNLAEWAISAAQNTDMTPGSHHSTLTWNGTTSTDWRTKTNWTSFIPDAGHNVSIPTASNSPVIGPGDNAFAYDLAITGNLTIQSDVALGDGSLITYGTVTGTASVQRYLGADRFWYVTKPVTTATANVFLHTWLFTYNEAGSAWTAFIEDPSTPLSSMKGYAVWTSSVNKFDQNLPPLGDTLTAYSGTLNTGTISTGLTKSGDGWNFVGNPYVSAVDWAATTGWTKTNLTANAYTVWTGTTNGTYTVGSGGTNGVTQYIPAAHGFFVNVSAAGTLGVSNAVRTHNTQAFYKAEGTMQNRLSLTISNGEVNDETVIYFNEAGTTDMDYEYDAPKLMAAAAPQAYTMMGTEKMAINTLNNTTQTPAVVLGVNIPTEGEYSLTASNIESFDASTPIYLEDVLTGQKISLREMSTYAFSAGEGTSERFVVHFAEYQGIGDHTTDGISSIYAGNRSVNVDYTGVKGQIVIYDILGQEIIRATASNGMNIVPVPNGNAVYVVKVISDNSAVTKKVFVK